MDFADVALCVLVGGGGGDGVGEGEEAEGRGDGVWVCIAAISSSLRAAAEAGRGGERREEGGGRGRGVEILWRESVRGVWRGALCESRSRGDRGEIACAGEGRGGHRGACRAQGGREEEALDWKI